MDTKGKVLCIICIIIVLLTVIMPTNNFIYAAGDVIWEKTNLTTLKNNAEVGNNNRIYFVNVNDEKNGDCSILQSTDSSGKKIYAMIDNGVAGAYEKVKSAISNLKIKRFEFIIYSHLHHDHISKEFATLKKLIENGLEIGTIYTKNYTKTKGGNYFKVFKELKNITEKNNIKWKKPKKYGNSHITLGDMYFYFFDVGQYSIPDNQGNNVGDKWYTNTQIANSDKENVINESGRLENCNSMVCLVKIKYKDSSGNNKYRNVYFAGDLSAVYYKEIGSITKKGNVVLKSKINEYTLSKRTAIEVLAFAKRTVEEINNDTNYEAIKSEIYNKKIEMVEYENNVNALKQLKESKKAGALTKNEKQNLKDLNNKLKEKQNEMQASLLGALDVYKAAHHGYLNFTSGVVLDYYLGCPKVTIASCCAKNSGEGTNAYKMRTKISNINSNVADNKDGAIKYYSSYRTADGVIVYAITDDGTMTCTQAGKTFIVNELSDEQKKETIINVNSDDSDDE